ncbi:hypothetical protein PGTUg99_028723 [Puccinia graminis f. sp. tritici]|uniref:Uncharacterized protein n=1 Tax=Puccinia graminis f. sp. tritici TaxID=56615 RepID=A0A5B0RVJ9_PUCGR|nr:hypothetical protein PGTUg99_028723 [Puccinia graminis f. sp. tritici]
MVDWSFNQSRDIETGGVYKRRTFYCEIGEGDWQPSASKAHRGPWVLGPSGPAEARRVRELR